ncbi:unnamed protein product [Sympodiomycopsis kandeliae]
MVRTPSATTSGGHSIYNLDQQALDGLFEATQKSTRCPDEDLLQTALASVPAVGINSADAVREDFDPVLVQLYPPGFLLSHNDFGGLSVRAASTDTGDRYCWALGEQELFGPRAQGPPTRGQVAMLFNSIVHHLVATFIKESASRLDPVAGGDVNMPNATPPDAGFKGDDHNSLIVNYALSSYPQYATDFMLKHLPEGKWRRTELVCLNGQSHSKELSFQQALGYIVLLPHDTLKTSNSGEEIEATHRLIQQLQKQHEHCQEQWMRQCSLLHDGRLFVLQMHERDGTVYRFPPVDPVRQPITLMKMINQMVFAAFIYTTDEDGNRADALTRMMNPKGAVLPGNNA